MADTKIPTIDLARRQALGALGSLGAASLLGCDASPSQAAEGAEICVLIPTETAGPFPLLSVLSDSRFMRADITEGQPGVPLNLTLEVVDVGRKCAPVAGAAVYVWHCSKEGGYSGYEQGAQGDHRGQTWLRGLQLTDGRGRATFRTIYPGWYPGRVTHIHFQVYIGDRPRRGDRGGVCLPGLCHPRAEFHGEAHRRRLSLRRRLRASTGVDQR